MTKKGTVVCKGPNYYGETDGYNGGDAILNSWDKNFNVFTGFLASPTNLNQEVLSPYMTTDTTIGVGEKVGKYQSGSGIILSADIDSSIFDWNKKSLQVEVYRVGNAEPIYDSTSTDGKLIVPFQGIGVGDYYWRARVIDDSGEVSDWREFGNNIINNADFSYFEGFEPYPYGYSFQNASIASGVLNGRVENIFKVSNKNIFNRVKIDGTRWDVFNGAFPESIFSDYNQMLDAFDALGMGNDEKFKGGLCFGLELSSILNDKYPYLMKVNFSDFYNVILGGTVWSNVKLSFFITSDLHAFFDKYNLILGNILSLHLYQYKKSFDDIINNQNDITPISILNTIKENPKKPYLLGMLGLKIQKIKLIL